MYENETAKKGLELFLIAEVIAVFSVILPKIYDDKILPAMLSLAAFIFLYRGISRLREFHRNYISAFHCLILNIMVGVALLILAVVLVLMPVMPIVLLWIDIALECVARPLLDGLQVYYICKATASLTDEAGYTRLASVGSIAGKVYMVGAILIVLFYISYLFLPPKAILQPIAILAFGLLLVGMMLALFFLYRARTRLS